MLSVKGMRLRPSLSSMLFLLLVLVAGGNAHGGHMDKIPDGAAVSDDPIVWPGHQSQFNVDADRFIRRMESSGRTSSS